MAKKVAKANDPRFEVLRMLTPEQKDKLLLKLFRKDPLLVEKLAFEFFEDKSDLTQRVTVLKDNINQNVTPNRLPWNTPGELMMLMRTLNGRITEHVKITKDKYGEVELTLFLLNTTFERFLPMLNDKRQRSEKFCEYVLKRTEILFKNLKKLHEDNYLDFRDDLTKLLGFLNGYSPTMYRMKEFDIPKSDFLD
jgi:hypothetical protein